MTNRILIEDYTISDEENSIFVEYRQGEDSAVINIRKEDFERFLSENKRLDMIRDEVRGGSYEHAVKTITIDEYFENASWNDFYMNKDLRDYIKTQEPQQ